MSDSVNRKALWRAVELGSVLFCLVGLRWASIVHPLPLNPDEVQAAANVLRGMMFGFNWNGMDGTTAGPLNSLVLAWPYLLGGEVSLSAVRLTAAVLLALSSFFTYLAVLRVAGRAMSLALSLPLVLFYGLTTNPNFLHYSSELLPLALLTATNVLLVRAILRAPPLPGQFYFMGLLLSCVPFAKLQATPMALSMGLFALTAIWIFWPERKGRYTAQIVMGALVVPLLFFVPLLLSGQLKEFWISYILWGMEYGSPCTTVSAYLKIIASDPVLAGMSSFVLALEVVLVALMCGFRSAVSDKRAALVLWAYAVSLLGMAIFVILKPGMGFLHYAHFYLPFLILLVAVTTRSVYFTRSVQIIFFVLYVLGFSFTTYIVHDYRGKGVTKFGFPHSMLLPHGFTLNQPNLYSWIPTQNSTMLIWGWMPHWYLLSGKVPATREAHTYGQTIPSSLREYFRARLMRDLMVSKPDLLLDAVTKTTFASHIQKGQTLHSLDPLKRLVDANYTKFSDYAETSDCASIYLENATFQRLSDTVIIPAVVAGPSMNEIFGPERLFDGSVTEDQCKDYWLLPDGITGPVTVQLVKPETIARVMLLNTRNGMDLDRAAQKVRLTFHRDSVEIAAVETVMQSYPNWTTAHLAPGVLADTVVIEVLSHVGRGAGLNEIKLFRNF